jgi:hypothetical protein
MLLTNELIADATILPDRGAVAFDGCRLARQ